LESSWLPRLELPGFAPDKTQPAASAGFVVLGFVFLSAQFTLHDRLNKSSRTSKVAMRLSLNAYSAERIDLWAYHMHWRIADWWP
jgi:hypothetical protein